MQLVMVKENLEDLPPVVLPDGYSIRHFLPGDEHHWENILNKSFGESNPPRSFDQIMGMDASCSPERVLFVTYKDIPIATASAWYIPSKGLKTGYVHYVGICPEHSGKKLGYLVSLAVLHRFVYEGRTRAVLQTDDFRVPAVKTYLQLGFQPFLVEEDQRQRWSNVINNNGFQELCPNLEEIVNGEIQEF